MTVKKRLGEMLMEAGIIGETQLKAALGHQRQWGVRLGQALVDLKLATEADIVRALAQKYGFDVARLDALEPYGLEQALALLPRDFAIRHNVFPMAADTASVTVAMSDPTNLAVADEIRFRTGRRVKVCIGGDREVAEAVRRHYPGGNEVEAIALDLDVDDTETEALFDPFGGGSKDALEAFFGGGDTHDPAADAILAATAAASQPAAGPARAPAHPSPPAPGPAAPARVPAPVAAPRQAAPSTPAAAAAMPAAAPPRPGPPGAAQPLPAATRTAPATAPQPPPGGKRPSSPAIARPPAQAQAQAAPLPNPFASPLPVPVAAAPAVNPFAAQPPAPARRPAATVPRPAAAPAPASRPVSVAREPQGPAASVEFELEDAASAAPPAAAPAPAPAEEAAARSERPLDAAELEILAALDRLASGGHAEPEIVRPTQAMAALARLLLRKGVITERELVDELVRR